MKIARKGEPGQEIPVAEIDGKTYDLRPLAGDIGPEFFAAGGFALVRAAFAAGELAEIDTAGQRFGAPLVRPGVILCNGMNYEQHAIESGFPPPAKPIMFYKHTNTLAAPNDDAPMSRRATKYDWEAELAFVVGKTSWELESPEAALAHIAAVTVADDMSERVWQLEDSGGQWSKGKSHPKSTPVGPYLVPVEDVDLGNLQIKSFVNDEPRQNSNTNDMIVDPATLLYHLSQYMQLDPGDLILTGTPEGDALSSSEFPFLEVGDVVRIEIPGIGEQKHTIVEY
ncbi:MAG: fumarylacetoacetate hydrolase family protein [Microbacteriaceae bacterium]|nr:fumarylacetoacetate hydrolase family protein [Microbacteriaceae bacterium]